MAPAVTPACGQAGALRASAEARLAQGKLDRATRELARAEQLCPEEATTSSATALEALLELGREAEAAALLAKMRQAPAGADAARVAQERARAALAGDEQRSADELVVSALEARKRGDAVRAQRLLDRAAASYEREQHSALSLDPPPLGIYPGQISWSRDGKWLAVADGPYMSLFSTEPFVHRFRFESKGFRRAARSWFSRDGSSVLIELCENESTTRCDLRVHRLPDGALRCSIQGPRTGWDRALSADGNVLADAFDAVVWDVATCSKRFEFVEGGAAAYTVVLSPDGKWLAVPGELWDVQAGTKVASLDPLSEVESNGTLIPSLAFRSDSKVLATLGEDRAVHLWSVPSGRRLRTLAKLKTNETLTIAGFDERTLAVTTIVDVGNLRTGGAAWLFDARSGAQLQQVPPPKEDRLWQAELSPDRRHLARFSWGPNAGPAELVDVASGKRLSLPAVKNAQLAFSGDSRWLAVNNSGSPLRIFDASSATEVATLPLGNTSSSGLSRAVALSVDGKALILGGDELQIWDLARGQRRATIERLTWQLAVSKENRLAAAGWELHLIDIERGLLEHSVATNSRAFLLGFSRAGDRVAAAFEDQTLRVFDARTGNTAATFAGLAEVRELKLLEFAADGRSVDASGSGLSVRADLGSGTLRRQRDTSPRDAQIGPAGQPLRCDLRPFGPGLVVGGLAISADCSTAATGRGYGPARLVRPSSPAPYLFFAAARAGEAAFAQSVGDGDLPERAKAPSDSDPWLEWLPGVPVEPLGKDARALLVCRAGSRVLPLEVCEERLLATHLTRDFTASHVD